MRLRRPDRERTPLRYTLPAAVLGSIVGWAVGVWLGWEPFFTAVGVLLLAQVVVDALWATR
jgi:uncharacterized membrane protein YfcA